MLLYYVTNNFNCICEDCLSKYSMCKLYYKGWLVYEESPAPPTGRFKATKHGVRIGAGSYDDIIRLIDFKTLPPLKGEEY